MIILKGLNDSIRGTELHQQVAIIIDKTEDSAQWVLFWVIQRLAPNML